MFLTSFVVIVLRFITNIASDGASMGMRLITAIVSPGSLVSCSGRVGRKWHFCEIEYRFTCHFLSRICF